MSTHYPPSRLQFFRGPLLHCVSEHEVVFLADAGLVINTEGAIEACDAWQAVESRFQPDQSSIIRLKPSECIIPGLLDLHVHLPQWHQRGMQAQNLLSWLEEHIFPEEARFANAVYARETARLFFQDLLRNGTTTAFVYSTSHEQATQIAFEEAEKIGIRMISGLNLMDTGAPENLCPPTQAQLDATDRLARRWHGAANGRLMYAWMPRFALTSSRELLAGIGQLKSQHPDIYVHTHLSEQAGELEAVAKAFPEARDYLDVYERYGLLGERSSFAHGIHLSESECSRLVQTRSGLVHCPSSNFFLKSGQFNWFGVHQQGIRVGLGSDVAAGPECSLFTVMKDAQYTQAHQPIPLEQLFYTATLGGAKMLGLDHRIGNLAPGKAADFLILDLEKKSSLANCSLSALDSARLLSTLVFQGDDRLVAKTYVQGNCCCN